jgi:hypothetical protein
MIKKELLEIINRFEDVVKADTYNILLNNYCKTEYNFKVNFAKELENYFAKLPKKSVLDI